MLLNLIYGPQRSTEHLQTRIPDIHKPLGELRVTPGSPLLIKTHFQLGPSMPLFDKTAGFIYIVRHPMDTMISNLNYLFARHVVNKDPALNEKIKQAYIEEFIRLGGDPNWVKIGFGSWIDHVRSWVGNDPGFPSLVLRYEDLLAQPAAHLRRIADFIHIQKSSDEIETAVDHSTFDRMQKIEEGELASRTPGFFMSENSETTIQAGCRFMNRGKAGEGEKELTHAQREKFQEKFGSTMEWVGY